LTSSKYGIVILGVFGSYARGEQKETSDVDILVKVERPLEALPLRYAGMHKKDRKLCGRFKLRAIYDG